MRSFLEALYGGWISPAEMSAPKNPEYRQINRKIDELRKEWQQKLTEENCEQLETILDLCREADSIEVTASFEYGFRWGAAIMVEVIIGREELLTQKNHLMPKFSDQPDQTMVGETEDTKSYEEGFDV
ncbi:MAG: hypothetical protein PVH64_11325 [Bacillota bacterium]|jgi:hypothetical protein